MVEPIPTTIEIRGKGGTNALVGLAAEETVDAIAGLSLGRLAIGDVVQGVVGFLQKTGDNRHLKRTLVR